MIGRVQSTVHVSISILTLVSLRVIESAVPPGEVQTDQNVTAGASSAANRWDMDTQEHTATSTSVLHDLVLSFRNPAKIPARRIAEYTHGAR